MKERLDILVVKSGLAPSREKAKTLIMAGQVLVDGEREEKPGQSFSEEAVITLKKGAHPFPFVSRGGAKLAKAVEVFDLDLTGRVCMDVGCSTGGFTDCMLQNGASSVYAVDVGYGQLDWKLRSDPRVTVMEKTNIRYLTPDKIGGAPSFVSIDVSFISLTKVLEPVLALMRGRSESGSGSAAEAGSSGGEIVALIKPQFEAGREKVGKKGVVRDPAVHGEVIERVILFARSLGLRAVGLDYSPIKGPEGNIEYLLCMQVPAEPGAAAGNDSEEMSGEEQSLPGGLAFLIRNVVEAAHRELD